MLNSTVLSLLLSLVQPRQVVGQRGVRVTRGPLGPFAGANFPCSEQDAHRGAPWARGACLITCKRPSCQRAIALCRRKPECSGVNINVEGTVATLKRETALCAADRRTAHLAPARPPARPLVWPDISGPPCSRRRHRSRSATKDIVFTQNRGNAGPGKDRHCKERDAFWPQMPRGTDACLLNCPKLNCTRGTALCFALPDCMAMDVGFGVGGHAAVARLRFTQSGAERQAGGGRR